VLRVKGGRAGGAGQERRGALGVCADNVESLFLSW
jgi:hypothetical protein